MFCPSCGTQTESGIKFCKKCGLALARVRGVMNGNETQSQSGQPSQPGWNEWLKDQVIGPQKSPEEKRLETIQNGLITTVAGIGGTIFLYFLMSAVAANEPREADIVGKIWLAGLIPTLVGLAMLFNAFFIGPKIVALKRREALGEPDWMPVSNTHSTTNSIDTNSLEPPVAQALPAANFDYSVTEHTTARLKDKIPIPASRDTN